MEWRRCNKCKDLKPINNFYFANKKENKRHYFCKECAKIEREKNKEKIIKYNKQWYEKNKENKLKENNKWKKENKERKKEIDKIYYEENKEKIKEYHKKYNEKNKEKIREQKKEYYIKNREKILERNKKRNIELAKTDVNYKIKKNVNRAILTSLKNIDNNKDKKKIEEIIGYPIAVLKDSLESQFEDWMNWENYGKSSINEKTWQIDHIIPQNLYNFFNEEEIKKCWHYKNLRPISSEDNLIKVNKLNMKLIKEYNIEDLLPEYLIID